MKIYIKENLIDEFKSIAWRGWIPNSTVGNVGGVGNTLEDLLGIEENNLPIPNVAEWELKAQRIDTTSLTTLFHSEPSPRAMKFVPQILLINYGWVGCKYPNDEMSFRQTLNGKTGADRGFVVRVDRTSEKVLVSFDASKVSQKHGQWLLDVERKATLGELNPQPYWGFDDLEHKAGTKLLNCFYVQAEVQKKGWCRVLQIQ